MSDIPAELEQALAGRYRLAGVLGQGGMATVFKAHDLRHERDVALKVLRPEVTAAIGTERFLREVRVMAGLSHPHILPLLDSGHAGTTLWYTMPYLVGESLRHRLEHNSPMAVAEALAITREVGSALEFAHRHHVVHRDIKPENILFHEGEAVVADFGIALVANAAQTERLTATGVSPGTLAYMSPEQLSGLREVDGRADQYALACVLHEMLTGVAPVVGTSAVVRSTPNIPAAVARALRKALAIDRDQRFASIQEFIEGLGSVDLARPRSRARLVAAVLVVATVAAAVVLPLRSRLARARAQALIPRATTLADQGRYSESYRLAQQAERVLGRDSALSHLFPIVADWLSVESVPSSAEVWLQRFDPDSGGRFPDSVKAGVTPLNDLRLSRGDYRLVVRLPGFVPAERMASTAALRIERVSVPDSSRVSFSFTLLPQDSVPAGMVPVAGGSYELVSPDLPTGLIAQLSDYFIDRTEVTNAGFREFVRAGGYATDSLWAGVERRPLVDRTGLPGPRSWSGQDLPAGRERFPVTDVSWYEARAYCAWRGGTIPTVFQWEKAARNGEISHVGTIMPWGLAGEATALRANFSTSGPAPVDSHPFGVSPWGARDMAGNVKEWTLNALGSGRVVTGGSWEDPSYLYSEYGEHAPGSSTGALGFRCARVRARGSGDQGAGPLQFDRRTPMYHPVDDRTFTTFLPFYRYDRRPLEPHTVSRVEAPDWIREKVVYRGVASDSALAYLYLPRNAEPPFQTLVYVAGSNVFQGDSLWHDAEWVLAPVIRSGRALLAPVLWGMTEREWKPGNRPSLTPNTVGFRDLMIRHSTELRLGIDYLATRPEIDSTKLVYVGLSFGAGSRLVLSGTDDRWRGVVLIGAGIDERMQPTLPEASNFNFAPRIKPPKLVINGRQDEEHPWLTRALPLWNLLREPKKLVLVEGAGHVPPPEALVPPMLQWLDEILGPVRNK